MNTNDWQQVKMAWIAAETNSDRATQIALLRDHPDAQEELTDFIAAYHISELTRPESDAILPLTERAAQTALERIFDNTAVAADLRTLRARQGLTLVQAARSLRLGADVWKKFEDGIIDLVSLSERQLERLAQFFHINAEQFGHILLNSQPLATIDRRQTAQAARDSQQPLRKQSFAEAIEKSGMPKAEKKEWL